MTIRRSLGAAMAALTLAAAVATPAAAVAVPYATAPLDSYNVKGTVYATVVIGDTVYVGGTFTEVKHKGVTYPATNLAAFDVATGALVVGFAPNPNKEVRALATDGSRLLVGGKFTSIGGAWRNRLAAVDPTSGVADPTFVPDVDARVDAVATDGTRVFFGGQFTIVAGTGRNRIAAVDATTGALDAWNPGADSNVAALALSPDAATIYVGGTFGTIGGAGYSKLAAVSTTTGAVVGADFSGANENIKSLDLNDDGSMLYAGDVGNDLEALSTSTGARSWRNTAPQGDVQATHYRDGVVYIGFHDGADGMTAARVAAIDAGTGATETSWNPTFQSTYGIFGIASTADALVVGGEFWQITGVAQDGVAIFPLA